MLRGWGRIGLWQTIERFVHRMFHWSEAQPEDYQHEVRASIKDEHLSLILHELSTSTEEILRRCS